MHVKGTRSSSAVFGASDPSTFMQALPLSVTWPLTRDDRPLRPIVVCAGHLWFKHASVPFPWRPCCAGTRKVPAAACTPCPHHALPLPSPLPHPCCPAEHPLDQLTPNEVSRASAAVRAHAAAEGLVGSLRFNTIMLHEPPKAQLLAYEAGAGPKPGRTAAVWVLHPSKNGFYEAVVQLPEAGGPDAVVSWKKVSPRRQGPPTPSIAVCDGVW
jgi:Cu2+-containing amine oxidase